MSGFYSNWVKVQHPFMPNDIPQMKSNGSQVPFYFGGSQVPENTNIQTNHTLKSINGNGILKNEFRTISHSKGKNIQTTSIDTTNKILKPRHLSSIMK